MLEKFTNRKPFQLIAIIVLVSVLLIVFYFFKIGNGNFISGIGEGPDSGTPKAFSEKSNDTKGSTDSTKDDKTNADLDLRIRESNDRKALSKVRSAATSVSTCITKELSNNKVVSEIYSNKGGCADKDYLILQDYGLGEQFTSDVILLTDKQKTRVCVYSLNETGNGVVSFSSGDGLVTNAGEGKTGC